MSNIVLESIRNNVHRLADKSITLGFDGFIDVIYKVIRSKDDHSAVTFFDTIHEFGTYITEKGEKNFSLEVEEMTTKIGGNMPIMANALAQFGMKQNCIGPLGYPSINPVFEQMPPNCDLFSFAGPGRTTALEFNGTKIMFAEIGSLNRIEWNTIKEIVGVETINELFSKPDLVCVLNWSEIDNSTAIWKGLLNDILPNLPRSKEKAIGFFDLADCSKRTPESILEALELLKAFSKYWNIVLSLNLNEAIILNKVLGGTPHETDVRKIGITLYDKLQISSLVIHYSKQALSWDASGFNAAESFYISNPVISTGAGDNFNAGYCAGVLMGLGAEASMILGHATSGYYMSNGKSPSIDDILDLLADKLKK